MSVSPEPFFVFVFLREKRQTLYNISQTQRQKYGHFADLNNLGLFMTFRYLSHMRKVKLKIACTVPCGVRCLKIGLNSLPQDGVSEHVYTIGLGSVAQTCQSGRCSSM